MPKANIRYTLEAIEDLKGIFDHIAQESIKNALSYSEYVEKMIQKLEDNPYLGMTCQRKRVRIDCRIVIVRSHLVIYRLDNNEVTIVRVLRDKQKYTDLLT